MTDEELTDEELVKALRDTYDLVKMWPEKQPDGFTNLLVLRNLVPDTANRIEALSEQLEAARADAKEAEAYAEELEKERDDYAFKLADANNTYGEMHVALIEANDKLATCEKYRDAYAECDGIGTQAVRDLEAKPAKAVVALRKLHHAVCGETGFAACVRLDSGLAYPWPALDEADEMTRALLAEIDGEKG
jgi:hypothetical protein